MSMRVGTLRISFMIFDAQSLKQKRQVLRSLKDRLMNTFNVSVAEIGSNDKWQIGELGIAMVANDSKFLSSALAEVRNFIGSNPAIRVIQGEVEIL
jgi:uncharacterized protein YlxP (DUF503 family)